MRQKHRLTRCSLAFRASTTNGTSAKACEMRKGLWQRSQETLCLPPDNKRSCANVWRLLHCQCWQIEHFEDVLNNLAVRERNNAMEIWEIHIHDQMHLRRTNHFLSVELWAVLLKPLHLHLNLQKFLKRWTIQSPPVSAPPKSNLLNEQHRSMLFLTSSQGCYNSK